MEVKIPLRIKTFIWLVLNKSILTKDILVHRGGKSDQKCVFCGMNETIDNLLFTVLFGEIHVEYGQLCDGVNCQFKNVEDCLLIWLKQFSRIRKRVITVGVAAVLWSIWKSRNMASFQQTWPSDPSVVLFQACYWIDFWVICR
jgi:hypothetical protein